MMVPPYPNVPSPRRTRSSSAAVTRTYTLRERWADYRADAKRNRQKGAGGVWVFRSFVVRGVVLSSPGCLWPEQDG